MPDRYIKLNDKEQKQLLNGIVDLSVQKKITSSTKERSVRYNKNKGASFQKWCAGVIADLFGLEWDNTNDRSPVKTRSMGNAGVDLIMQEPLYSQFPFDVECKNTESLSVIKTIEQASKNTKKGRFWMILWKHKTFDKPIVIIDWDAFVKIWKK